MVVVPVAVRVALGASLDSVHVGTVNDTIVVFEPSAGSVTFVLAGESIGWQLLEGACCVMVIASVNPLRLNSVSFEVTVDPGLVPNPP